MPYRSDSRDDAERRLRDATAAHEETQKRVRATAAGLQRLTRRFQRELTEADHAVAEAESALRAMVRHGLAQDGGEHTRVRTALRSAGVMAALERAIRRAKPRDEAPTTPRAPTGGFAPERPGDSKKVRVMEAESRLAEARKTRARLNTQREPTLEAAKARMHDAVLAHDDATRALEAALARLDAEQR
ncbi:MAG: hypothetical protein AB8I08_14220 [Sandaracinaceae bacterium]